MNIDQAADVLWRSIEQGVHDPAELRGRIPSVDEAYRIQFALLERHERAGARRVGWKIGFTAKAIQEQMGVHEPVLGFLLDSSQRPAGAAFDFDALTAPAIENELCITMGADLPGPDVTLEQARSAIGQVAPAFEIIELRLPPPLDVPLMVADNVAQKAFVTGTPVSVGGLDLARVTLEMLVDDVVRERASGAAVLGSPVAAIAWLANKLAECGQRLAAGDLVMSGSFTRQCAIQRGDTFEARFDPIGNVRATFR